jgi:hypothetical protein
MIAQHNDALYGPVAPSALKFYADILAAAKLQDPAAYLDWEVGLTIPEVVWSGKRLLVTYVMRDEAVNLNRTAADVLNGVVTPDVKIAWQREVLAALESGAKAAESGAAEVYAFIEKLKAFWLTPQGGAAVPAPGTPPPVVVSAVPKPEGWDSTYVLKNTPFGLMWMKP